MKKFLASLGTILLVAILGVAVVFAYGSYKDLELKKEKTKLADKKHNTIDKQDKNNDNQTNTNQTNGNQEQATSINKQNIDNSYDPNNIMKNDTNSDGVITRDEMTPELEKLEREGKLQVAVKGIDTNDDSNKENQPKYTAEDAKNMSDDEFLEAYKEGMSEEEAAAVDSRAEGSGDYIDYLRGQVEARANGQGGNY
ncbi:hypothetical protein ISO99_08155 [Staphylococcus sp. 18_1_E_LY]|uniref:EF-hand domain-containing protein n=1 Tax=Staphylococcus lloydii TaxID=2781774 RepID=A0A7T1B049_9STAP|nr:hypothetical protein [Staphylococcus lloydii]MBF7019879.1 hypothetical protein [Staphylococcus lloydii]MBF7027562.1 hypothetical protein [Staphylococcus lloydii]QPM75252.1 hypothetical protein ISP08_00490 [Staphylococcus lloydii]